MDKTDTKDEYDWKQTDISSLIPGPDAVVKYVRYQEERIKTLEIEAKRREAVIHSQDVAMNQMMGRNIDVTCRLDYHMLANVVQVPFLIYFVGVYFW